ncbi:hypothetical protein JGG81_25530 [Salmonella enterica subsp. enterica serovar Typhimurium]|nr:hypothetical protein [Salmonella enterica subsp. enterica serovar Typhimurium]
MMVYGRELRLPCDLLFGRPEYPEGDVCDYVASLQERLEKMHDFTRNNVQVATERMKTRYDVKATEKTFKEGELVWIFSPCRRKGLSPKLQRNWDGPYKVIKKLNDVVYRVQRRSSSSYKFVHIDRIAPYQIGANENVDIAADQSYESSRDGQN